MKKNLLSQLPKKTSLLFIICSALAVFIVGTAFTNLKTPVACTGIFYTTNALGPGFAILAPGTGAPNNSNGTCHGCHTTYANNSGPGVFTLDIGGGITQYVPGQSYLVTVTLTQASTIAMDFEVTNRDQVSSNAKGVFTITDPQRTQKTNGNFGGAGVDYVEGTACGVDVISSGYNQWTFSWTAPTTGVTGNITFYAAAVAANFNNQNTLDYTYSTTKVLSAVAGINEADAVSDLNLFPNPATENFTLDYTLNAESKVEIKLVDLQGKLIDVLFSSNEKQGKQHHEFAVKKKYAAGTYFIQINANNKTTTQKLFIE